MSKKAREISKDNLAELQITEQALQNLLLQKQVFQIELVEVNNAIEELKKSKDGEVFKIVGSLMFKSNREELMKEMEKKKELLDLRIRAIEKQEESIKNKLTRAREEVLKDLKK
ncbi:MAG: prefoldin subunit beta [Candidatus Pacearchaeota archaeon]|nr:prefoldin subunit beta [Candidatus Pacearchaeota archaeon]